MPGIAEYIISSHAETEMQRRGIGRETVVHVMAEPEQAIDVRPGRIVLQSRVAREGDTYLVRVFVDVDKRPAEVVTVYRTSKLSKYWRTDK